MSRETTFSLPIVLILVLSLAFAACGDSPVEEPPPEEPGDPVFTLDDIDGSWQQEDEPRRYLDIRSDEGDDGVFYEAFFQDDDEAFEQTDCYAVVENVVLATNEGQFTIEVHDEEEDEPYEVQIRFEVETDDNGNPQRVRMIREDNGFDGWFHPSDLTVDDYEPRCADLENDNDDPDS